MKPYINTLLKLACTSAILLALSACGGSDNDGSSRNTELNNKLQGNWEQSGYGKVLSITGSSTLRYDYTSKTCTQTANDDLDDLTTASIAFKNDDTGFSLQETSSGFPEHYTKLPALPDSCSNLIADQPGLIFEHVWHTFNEYYAFFNEREVDWLAQYDALRDFVHNDMSDEQLLDVLLTLIDPIDDSHVSLTLGDGRKFSPALPKGFLIEVITEYLAQNVTDDFEEYLNQQLDLSDNNIVSNYLDGTVKSTGGPDDDIFSWGVIDAEVGYLNIARLLLSFNLPISQQVSLVETILDQILTDLADTSALIIDVRLTPGGTDAISMAIASRFSDMERPAIHKVARSYLGEGERQDMILKTSSRIGYHKPVIVITSGLSGSATEVFTLAMRTLPQVTHIGESTNGALSDVLHKPLPNGWTLGLSNEVYYDHEGISHEVTGIPPHIETPVFKKADRDNGDDSAISAALQLLGVIR